MRGLPVVITSVLAVGLFMAPGAAAQTTGGASFASAKTTKSTAKKAPAGRL